MAVQSDTSRISYAGNNSTTTSYAVPFVFLENAHLKAFARTAAGVESVVTLTNHTGAGDVNGGTVRTSVAIPATSTLTIYRDVPITQTTTYAEGGDFPAASHERALDKLTTITQQLDRRINTCIRGSEATPLSELPSPTGTQQYVLAASSNQPPSWQLQSAIATGPIIATGSTQARFISDRFADMANVKDFGAVGDGVADDTAAIQAAIDANAGKAIYFPSGIYKFSQQLRIKRNNTCLIGDARNACQLWYFANTDQPAVLVQSESGNASHPDISGVVVANLGFNKLSATTQNSICIEFDRGLGCSMTNCYVSGFPSAIITSGCRNCYFSNLALNARNFIANTPISSASVVTIRNSTTGGGITGFTIVYDNCIIGAVFTSGRAVTVSGNDYAAFSNCYISGATVEMVNIVGAGDHTYDCWFDQCYFDGGLAYSNSTDQNGDGLVTAADSPTPLGVHIRENSPTASRNAIHNFTDCTFGQMDAAMYIDEETATEVGIIGCRFRYCYEDGISCASDDVDLRVVGCTFRDCIQEIADRGCIRLVDASSAVISGNVFYFPVNDSNGNAISYKANTRAIVLGGSCSAASISITGNTFTSNHANISDIGNGGATITSLVISGNASNNTVNSAVGNLVGNADNSNANTLDWYQEGTWTPTLEFDGATTAITYSAGQRTGSFTRIGNRVYFDCYFLLTNKGSASGAATISGLPFSQNAASPASYTISVGAMAAALGDANVDAGINSSDVNEIRLYKQSGGSRTNMTEADFENTTNIIVTGAYRV